MSAAGSTKPPPFPPPFPWDRALAIGLGILRLPPHHFWRMTPRELASAMRGLFGDSAPMLDRAALNGLMRRFPDLAEFKTKGI